MSTFAELVTKPGGCGVAYLVEVSTDKFSTVSYRWGTTQGKLDGTNEAEARVANIGSINRALSPGNAFGVSTTALTLDNTDGGVDWMLAPSTVESTLIKASFKLKLVVWNLDDFTDRTTKTLGIFVCLNLPRRVDGTVRVELADNALGDAAEMARAPSMDDWLTDAGTNGTNAPFQPLERRLDEVFYSKPTKLVFGETARGELVGWDATRSYAAVLLCATTNTDDVTTADVDRLWVSGSDLVQPQGWNQNAVGRPDEWEVPRSVGGLGVLWEARKSHTITVDGKDWRLIWVKLNLAIFALWVRGLIPGSIVANPGTGFGGTGVTITYRDITEYLPAMSFRARGYPFSFRSIATTSPPDAWVGSAQTHIRGVAIAYDLLGSYSQGLSLSDLDAASFTEVLNAGQTMWAATTIDDGESRAKPVYDWQARKPYAPGGRMREAISSLSSSNFFDVFTGWDGKFRALSAAPGYAASVAAFTAAPVELSELLAKNIADRIPQNGERWAPHNRVLLNTAGGLLGPFDSSTAVTSWGRILERVVSASAMTRDSLAQLEYHGGIFNTPFAEARVRPVLTFSYPLDAMTLEIGDYFVFSWSRGGGNGGTAPYSNALWRVEGMTLHPLDCTVDITAVWMNNLRTEVPFLLDDRTMATRAYATFGRSVIDLEDSMASVNFSSGDLLGDGVEPGDVLVLEDAVEAVASFKRNRAIRIVSVDSATSLTVDSADLDFGAPTPVTVDNWTILRGATTYGVAPETNYEDGGYMYGKAADGTEFSGATPDGLFDITANLLMG